MFRTATRRVVAAMLGAATLLAPLPAGAHTTPPAAVTAVSIPRQQDLTEGLRVTSRQVVEVDLEASVLSVRHEVELRNEVPDRTIGEYVERAYWSTYAVPVFMGATGVRATRSDGRALPVRVTAGEGGVLSVAEIDLQPDLFFGETQSLVLTYQVTTQPLRSGSLAQVNQAVATFPLVGLGDPGRTDVEVRLPAGHVLDVVGAEMTETTEGDEVVLRATDIADPAAWVTSILVRNDEALQTREVAYGPHTVVLQGWPGDDEWLEATADLAERGLPALESVIGWGWGEARTIEVVETVSPYLYGYAGWYRGTGDAAVIEVGDALEPHVTLHEMAHAWFNASTFSSRWASEAFADETAALAMAQLGLERPSPEPASTDQPGALPLQAWEHPDLQDPETDDQERYGYNTSWWVARQVSDEIGADRLRDVLVAVHARRSAYDPAAELADDADLVDIGVVDWRELLDLVQDVGGSDVAPDLWRTFVVDESQVEELVARDRARAAYARLADDDWQPPRALRDQMTAWDFDAAAELDGDVAALYDRRDELATRYDARDLALPESLEDEFEAAQELDDVEQRFDQVDEALDAVDDADASVDGANLLQRVGLLFEDPSVHVDRAVSALEAGAYAQATRQAEIARRRVDDATRDGVLRSAGAVGLAALGAYGVHRLRRRRPGMRSSGEAQS